MAPTSTCESDARESRHRRDSDRTPPRRLAGDAVSIYARRADREYPRRLRTAALSQRWDAPGRLQPIGGRRQCAIAVVRAADIRTPAQPKANVHGGFPSKALRSTSRA